MYDISYADLGQREYSDKITFRPSPTKCSEIPYIRCLWALYYILNKEDKETVKLRHPKTKKILKSGTKEVVHTISLLDKFTYVGTDYYGHDADRDYKCVCGVPIVEVNVYYYCGINYAIGSECNQKWNQTIKEVKEVQDKKRCKYCLRKWNDPTKVDCKYCNGKKQTIAIFQGLKNYMDTVYRFDFGKHYGKTIASVYRIDKQYLVWAKYKSDALKGLAEAQKHITAFEKDREMKL